MREEPWCSASSTQPSIIPGSAISSKSKKKLLSPGSNSYPSTKSSMTEKYFKKWQRGLSESTLMENRNTTESIHTTFQECWREDGLGTIMRNSEKQNRFPSNFSVRTSLSFWRSTNLCGHSGSPCLRRMSQTTRTLWGIRLTWKQLR